MNDREFEERLRAAAGLPKDGDTPRSTAELSSEFRRRISALDDVAIVTIPWWRYAWRVAAVVLIGIFVITKMVSAVKENMDKQGLNDNIVRYHMNIER